MQSFFTYIGGQFGNPRGFIGRICCLLMNAINRPMYRAILGRLRLPPQARVLDIGYGNGYLVGLLYRAYQPHIYGIDISPDMQALAIRRNRKAMARGRLHLSVGDCCNLTYPGQVFHAVTSVNTIYFWPDTLQGLQEVCRVLMPEGIFYNVVYTVRWLKKSSYTRQGFRFFTRQDYVRLGKQAGFSKVTFVDIVPGRSFMVLYYK